jgi:GntR family transcriptional regulator
MTNVRRANDHQRRAIEDAGDASGRWPDGSGLVRGPTLARKAALEIIAGIQSGALAGEGGLLPSEAVLSQRLGVSRATLREALSQLEQGGMIVRRHGIGTFVSPGMPLMEAGLEQLESIETLAERIGVEIHMGECRIEERTASAREAEYLAVPEGSPVYAVQRVMVSGELPIAYLVDVVPADALDPRELRDDFEGSVLDLLLRHGDPQLRHSYTELCAEAADRELVRWLRLRKGDPLLRLTAQLYATDGRVVDYSTSYFTPGHFKFHVIRRVNQLSVRG